MNTENSRLDEEEVLLAFSVELQHDHVTLERYLDRYPEHTLALVDCSIELMMDASNSGEDVQVSSDQVVDQAWRQFQAAMGSPTLLRSCNPQRSSQWPRGWTSAICS
jgi:hypothetical protein